MWVQTYPQHCFYSHAESFKAWRWIQLFILLIHWLCKYKHIQEKAVDIKRFVCLIAPSQWSNRSIHLMNWTTKLNSSAEKYSSLSSAAALFTSLALNTAKSSIPFSCIKCHSKAWWSAEVEGGVRKRCKAFAAAHRSDEDCQAYISASRRTLSVIAKAEAWQATCSSLSPKSNPKTVYSLLCSIAGSPSSSPNFPNCSSPRESASVYAAYLDLTFPFLSQRPCVAEPEATFLRFV